VTTGEIHGDSVLLRSADPDATLRALFMARDDEGTVRNYLSSAIGKTGARNRIEAAQAAEANGWLTAEP
jgi:two-component system response regulator DesR